MIKAALYLLFALFIAYCAAAILRTIVRHRVFFAVLSYLKMKRIDRISYKDMDQGITSEGRSPRLIVSLTSFPERIKELHYCVYTLLTQSVKPDLVIVWLSAEQFPNKEKDLPQKLLQLREKGLTIKWCNDIGPYKKLVPTLKEFPSDIIVTADDDAYYPKNWLELLITSYGTKPEQIHCHRAHRIKFDASGEVLPYSQWQQILDTPGSSYANIFTGVGGVLYPPHSLFKDVIREDLFMSLSPSSDDLWFWAMGVLNKTRICLVKNNISKLLEVIPHVLPKTKKKTALGEINIANKQNDINMKNILSHYPSIKQILVSETSTAS